MSSSETHHHAVCALNVTTGFLSTWRAMSRFIGALLGQCAAETAIWDVFFTSAWTLLWVYLPEITGYGS